MKPYSVLICYISTLLPQNLWILEKCNLKEDRVHFNEKKLSLQIKADLLFIQ